MECLQGSQRAGGLNPNGRGGAPIGTRTLDTLRFTIVQYNCGTWTRRIENGPQNIICIE